MAVGDFNKDGKDDLIVSSPLESIKNNTVAKAGAFHVIYGSANGLTTANSKAFSQETFDNTSNLKADNQLGCSLAVADFNSDTYDDLAVGSRWRYGSGKYSTMIYIFFGSPQGLSESAGKFQKIAVSTPANQTQVQSPDYTTFDSVLAAGDFGYDQQYFGRDLAIGIPKAAINNVGEAGMVLVLFGRQGMGIDPTIPQQVLHQDVAGIEGGCEAGDWFGSALATGRFGSLPPYEAIAVGASGEGIIWNSVNQTKAGAFHVILENK
ncbi:MAG: hypothetical protein R3F23_00365 [Verrucomicrobiia bacterium]